MMRALFAGRFSWARAIGVPMAVIVAVFLDAGGLTLQILGFFAGIAGLLRLVEGTWARLRNPVPEGRAAGTRKAVSGTLTLAGLAAAAVVFLVSFERAREAGRRAAERVQAACNTEAGCPQDLGALGWAERSAGWAYRFPLHYVVHKSGATYALWVRAGIDQGTVFAGGRDQPLVSCSRLAFEQKRCGSP